ncbi:MAG: rhomboid family intramembrane serine protease [Saprospiraceae bacterium]|nr:MAG: rhomboid family protein [Bacteroidetes bacterium OLB9]MCO6464336.1 rhomboid family intramembrane serine protease [Saprospiraceae bacterium]MCZ2338315.1 rhomboid family intramembrane serine protease [Chitinophagales bacterium]
MRRDISEFIYQIRFPLLLLLTLWVIRVADVAFGLGLTLYGIYPRDTSSFLHIFTAPFIHASWGHLASNSIPMLVLTTILVIFYRKVAFHAFFSVMVGSGLLVWLFARPSYHVGASGIVYGLISFIFWTGVFKKNKKSIILSAIILILYSGSVEGIFPNVQPNISWESHLFGALVGIVVAFVLKNVVELDEEKADPEWVTETQDRHYFLPRDAFEKTRLQRYYEFMEQERIRQQLMNNPDNQ